jgi:outer membrane protein assembly factor BamB
LAVTSLPAAHWPQFRGPAASGQIDGPAAPTTWNISTGENIRWRTPVPGLAHVSPIVWGDHVFVATAVKPGDTELKVGLYGSIEPVNENEPVQWHLLALDLATGKVLWNTLALEAVPRVGIPRLRTAIPPPPPTDGASPRCSAPRACFVST